MNKLLVIALALCFLVPACKDSKAQEAETDKILRRSSDFNPPDSERRAVDENAPILVITDIQFSPQKPTIGEDLTAEPHLKNMRDGVYFTFKWFINDTEVDGVTGETLEKRLFKKKDWIQCYATAHLSNTNSGPFLSQSITISNVRPELTLDPVTAFAFPGLFSYQVSAHDADNDPLKYELVSPADQGIEIDAATGLIRWNVTKEMIPNLPAAVEIHYRVVDTEGAAAEGKLTLNLTKKST